MCSSDLTMSSIDSLPCVLIPICSLYTLASIPIVSVSTCISISTSISISSPSPSHPSSLFPPPHALVLPHKKFLPWSASPSDPEATVPSPVQPSLKDHDSASASNPGSSAIIMRGAGSVPRRPRQPNNLLKEAHNIFEARIDRSEDRSIAINLSSSRHDITAFLSIRRLLLPLSRSSPPVPDLVPLTPLAHYLTSLPFSGTSSAVCYPQGLEVVMRSAHSTLRCLRQLGVPLDSSSTSPFRCATLNTKISHPATPNSPTGVLEVLEALDGCEVRKVPNVYEAPKDLAALDDLKALSILGILAFINIHGVPGVPRASRVFIVCDNFEVPESCTVPKLTSEALEVRRILNVPAAAEDPQESITVTKPPCSTS